MNANSSSDSDEPPKGSRWLEEGALLFNRQRKIRADWDEVRDFLQHLPPSLLHTPFAVLLLSDSAIRRYNKLYRNQNHATDVLSFPVRETGVNEPDYLGDILISAETASKNAKRYGNRLEEEVKILILHGVLHLLGYDHETDGGKMAKAERAWSRKLGLGASLTGRAKRAAKGRSAR